MAKAPGGRKAGPKYWLQRFLGTNLLGRQVKLLRDQNQSLTRQNDALRQLVEHMARQNKTAEAVRVSVERMLEQNRSFRTDLLPVQKEIASLARKMVAIQSHDRSRLDQISYAMFELNRTLYAHYRKEAFDLGRSGDGFFSQNGEDGIIGEIARRLNIELKSFVEIGAGDGQENNSIQLLLGGASGLWIEGDAEDCGSAEKLYPEPIREGRLRVVKAWVTAENVNDVLRDGGAPEEVDLLSIDIDGNDYWVWRALTAVSPRILCLEYNPFYGPNISWVKAYEPDFVWPGKNIYYGASLKALEKLSREKGFTLVACDYSGVNAFFVRDDLVNEKFKGPFTAEDLFQPFRGNMGRRLPGKKLALGPHENV